MVNTLYLPELREMLASSDVQGLCDTCTALHPARTAEFMEGLTAEEAWGVLRCAPMETRAQIFGYFDLEKQIEVLETCDRKELSQLVAELPPDDRVDLLKQVDESIVEDILKMMPAVERRDILQLSEHPEDTAGSIMTSEVPRLPESFTVGEAIEEIRTKAAEWETIYYIYIVDNDSQLKGVVTARQLLSNAGKPEKLISDLMVRDVFSVDVDEDKEHVAAKVAQYDLHAIPVVDAHHRLLGIITHDDIIDVVRDEATEDAQRFAGVDPLEDGYLQTRWPTLVRKRLPWLVILFFASLLTAFALKGHEEDLGKVSWLAIFIPLIVSCGGNSGNQSATLIITSLSTGNIKLDDFYRILRREIVMGLCLGGALCMISFAMVLTIGLAPTLRGALVIMFTILMVVNAGTLLGATLPLLFKRLGLDPALMSNSFVAGIIDILGIVIYLMVARALLPELAV